MLKLTVETSEFTAGDYDTAKLIADKLGVTVDVFGTDGYRIDTFFPTSNVPAPAPIAEVPTPVFTPVFTPPEPVEQTNG